MVLVVSSMVVNWPDGKVLVTGMSTVAVVEMKVALLEELAG